MPTPSNICCTLYTHLNTLINQESFKIKHRLKTSAFTRNRLLNFPTLVLFLLNFRKNATQTELDQFFKLADVNKNHKFKRLVNKAALTKSRKNLSYQTFIDINNQLIDKFYAEASSLKKWHGHRLCAIDGSTIRLPNEVEIVAQFGVKKGRLEQRDCPMAMASVFYDVLNNIAIDASIMPSGYAERECATTHLQKSNQEDIILYDRGYTGFWFYAYHLKHNRVFCIRTKTNQELAIKDFINSGKKQDIIEYLPNKTSQQTCQDKGLSIKPIKLRLIRVNLANTVEVLVTNLMDEVRYPAHSFKKLYHLRWGIEENYKKLKQWIEIENFSGKSALSIRQDFYAKIVANNMTAFMVFAGKKN